jgi:hypothetical protein
MIATSNFSAIIASRYRPIRLIATGGMGAVYEVEHTSTGERLALKVLHSSTNASPDALARFKREARASARIKSENIVRVIDADVSPELGGAPFLVMELLEGTDLERAATTTPPAPATVIEWLRPVARAIDKAHRLGFVHRDLKPENLFLATRSDGPPQVKILDFGIVKMIEEETGATGTGQVLGTPKYMGPEQASANAQVTPATDRCALGLIAYRLLMGESYYQGGVLVVLGQLLYGQLEAPSERGSRFGGAFDAWFLKACHRNPEERFASASAQVEALAGALGLLAVPLEAVNGSSLPLRWRPGNNRSIRALLTAVSITAVLVAAVVGARHAFTARRLHVVVCGLPNGGATATCGQCVAQDCCTEAQACAGTDGCPQIDACVRACASGDAMCRAGCYASKGAVAQLQQGVESCRASRCAKECLPPQWECLGRVKWRTPNLTPQTIVIKTKAICPTCGAGGGPAALAGAIVRVCSIADPKCHLPLAAGTSDGNGAVALQLDTSLHPPPLAVFLEYRKDGFLDTLFHLNTPPVTGDLDVGAVPVLDPKVNTSGFARMLGTTYNPARAFVGTRPVDCNGQYATKKIAMTWLDRDDQTATTPYFAYSDSANGINLPINTAGVTRIVARVAETNQLIATTSIVVRPRGASLVTLAPAP